MSLEKSSYKGTRDLYPADMRLRKYIFARWRKVCERFGYEEYAAPMIEPLATYAAKSGEEIVNEQTFSFTDRGGREMAIRPEMTPSIARMVAAERQEMPYPARLFSIANFMRYERPQHGREREFWQLNFDIFGASETAADTEILLLSHEILREFGARDEMYTIKIGDRRLTDLIFGGYFALAPEQTAAMIKLLDRYAKISRASFEADARAIAPEFDFAKFDAIIAAQKIDDLPAEIRDSDVAQSLENILSALENRGITNARYDPTLMRGFDYYTGTVFEVFDEAPENRRAMFGGGRYDGLVGLFGVADLPVVGAAPGETMFVEFLRAHELLPKIASSVDLIIATVGEIDPKILAEIAENLRAKKLNVAVDFTARKLDKKIKAAVKRGVARLVIVGETEAADFLRDAKTAKFPTKILAENQQTNLTLDEIAK